MIFEFLKIFASKSVNFHHQLYFFENYMRFYLQLGVFMKLSHVLGKLKGAIFIAN